MELCVYIKADAQVLQHALTLIAVACVRVLAKSCLSIKQISIHTGLIQGSGLRHESGLRTWAQAGLRTQMRLRQELVSSQYMSWWKDLSSPSALQLIYQL